MDKIEAIKSKMPYMKDEENLLLFINGVRFDEVLTNDTGRDFLGLIPSWLNFYDEDFEPSKKEKEYVWNQTKLDDKIKTLPIMLCPDDFDFSCTVIVAEVINESNTVVWNRLGTDTTGFDINELELPKYIGKTIEWFENIGPYFFDKDDYLYCVEAFLHS